MKKAIGFVIVAALAACGGGKSNKSTMPDNKGGGSAMAPTGGQGYGGAGYGGTAKTPDPAPNPGY
jgi:hypothetical protein